jgi:hypothetical protein
MPRGERRPLSFQPYPRSPAICVNECRARILQRTLNGLEIGLPERRAASLKRLDHKAGHDGAAVKLIYRDIEECAGGAALGRSDGWRAHRLPLGLPDLIERVRPCASDLVSSCRSNAGHERRGVRPWFSRALEPS